MPADADGPADRVADPGSNLFTHEQTASDPVYVIPPGVVFGRQGILLFALMYRSAGAMTCVAKLRTMNSRSEYLRVSRNHG